MGSILVHLRYSWFMLSLLTYTQRRRDMVAIGGTFVITSAVMYFLFIMLMIGLGDRLESKVPG